jgi:hypothetical protein
MLDGVRYVGNGARFLWGMREMYMAYSLGIPEYMERANELIKESGEKCLSILKRTNPKKVETISQIKNTIDVSSLIVARAKHQIEFEEFKISYLEIGEGFHDFMFGFKSPL